MNDTEVFTTQRAKIIFTEIHQEIIMSTSSDFDVRNSTELDISENRKYFFYKLFAKILFLYLDDERTKAVFAFIFMFLAVFILSIRTVYTVYPGLHSDLHNIWCPKKREENTESDYDSDLDEVFYPKKESNRHLFFLH